MTDRLRSAEFTPVHLPGEEEEYSLTVYEFDNVLVGDRNLKTLPSVQALSHNQAIQLGYLLNALGVPQIDPERYKS